MDQTLTKLSQLIKPGTLGFYTHFEVTEVVAFEDATCSAINIFTIVSVETRPQNSPQIKGFLNHKRIKLKSLTGWSFGVMRYTQPVSELIPALEILSNSGEWKQSGKSLKMGNLFPLPLQFVPPDSSNAVALNCILKNNFWNGSHVFEWVDKEKLALHPFFDDPRRLQELSEAIQSFVPLRLASISDRLGNLLIQLPVTVLMSKFRHSAGANGLLVELAWHPNATARPLQANCDLEFDGVICGYMSSAILDPETHIPMPHGQGVNRGVIWDEQHQIILSAIGALSSINTISLNMHISDPEPRVFVTKQKGGELKSHSINLSGAPINSLIGEPHSDTNGSWTQKRIYTNELSQLTKDRRFVQYKPGAQQRKISHEDALKDIRHLINLYGEKGVWLWDPYLSAHDILETLFHCKHSGAVLRALTSINEAPDIQPTPSEKYSSNIRMLFTSLLKLLSVKKEPSKRKLNFMERQIAELEGSQSNWRGLHLEYRIRRGQDGWGFHDRFLIFPKTERGPLAWSLGTSVNSFGVNHHILQQVDDGQLVVDAFLDLWEQLNKPEYLIWKKP